MILRVFFGGFADMLCEVQLLCALYQLRLSLGPYWGRRVNSGCTYMYMVCLKT
jgi:hypothetical protein